MVQQAIRIGTLMMVSLFGIRAASSSPATEPKWLSTLNGYRAMSGLPSVTENPEWSDGDYDHARYMVKNDVIEHFEAPTQTWYTPEGDAAARNSNLHVSTTVETEEWPIYSWMTAPFHAVGMIDPALQQVGYGIYTEGGSPGYKTGAALDVLRGLGETPSSASYPILWPGDGTETNLLAFEAEHPDPLASCPGYVAPAGLPLIAQFAEDPSVSSHSLMRDGAPVEHCVFDEFTYLNPDHEAENLGRGVLDTRNAVVMVPKRPLRQGSLYTASLTSGAATVTWSFRATLPTASCLGNQASLVGTPDADLLAGTAGRDVIAAGGGDDRVRGRGANDIICGESGADLIVGGRGSDVLRGGAEDDWLVGGLGRDSCRGGPGVDFGRTCP